MIQQIESTTDLPGSKKKPATFEVSQHGSEEAARTYADKEHPGKDGYLRLSKVLPAWYLFVQVPNE